MKRRSRLAMVAGLFVASGSWQSLRAERQELAEALDFAGFELFGTQNPLSGGIDFLAVADYDGRRFDFGAGDIAFDGPISFEVNTGGRLLSRFDVSFQTGLNATSAPQTLAYQANLILGGQNTNITGTLLLDGHFGIDALGFYDLQLRTSSRQLTTPRGDTSAAFTRDADVGPINVSGNIFVDVLAIVTDPFFARTGRENPFDNMSGLSELAKVLHTPTPSIDQLLTGAVTRVGADIEAALADATTSRATTAYKIHTLPPQSNGKPKSANFAVPEPAGLLLLLIGLPFVIRRSVYGH